MKVCLFYPIIYKKMCLACDWTIKMSTLILLSEYPLLNHFWNLIGSAIVIRGKAIAGFYITISKRLAHIQHSLRSSSNIFSIVLPVHFKQYAACFKNNYLQSKNEHSFSQFHYHSYRVSTHDQFGDFCKTLMQSQKEIHCTQKLCRLIIITIHICCAHKSHYGAWNRASKHTACNSFYTESGFIEPVKIIAEADTSMSK